MSHETTQSPVPRLTLAYHPPRVDRWPLAERSLETQQGTLVRCGPGLRLASWPETPRVRAAAIAPWLRPEYVATHVTAAWIWGAWRVPDEPLEFSTQHGRRAGFPRDRGYLLRQLSLAPEDVRVFGEQCVTSPERTVFDLLRTTEPFTRLHRIACRILLLHDDITREALRERLIASGKARRGSALERLARL